MRGAKQSITSAHLLLLCSLQPSKAKAMFRGINSRGPGVGPNTSLRGAIRYYIRYKTPNNVTWLQ